MFHQRALKTGPSRPGLMCRLDSQHTAALLHRLRLRTQQQPSPLNMIQRVGHQRVATHIEIGGSDIEMGAAYESGGSMGHKPVDSIRYRSSLPVGSKLGLGLMRLPGRTGHVSAQNRKCSSTVAWRSE